ncbi:chemotaxis protein CheB [Cognatilysobacter segetis]|uniref:chemotaxis protein CheB n=1 Tax=Cognatilysobacter segetis TaxID=2492394 RepID=UPI001060BC49|nr:chemotaxis protein CheB [Lysobacter segetis]
MSETGRRVALLARPGTARDCVRNALLEVGADIVAEEDPGSASAEAIRGTAPEVLMIVLDAVSENALDRFDSMLGDPAIEVMFEEADVAASRDGWEAARWRRHLAAKLHHRDDVLPPVAGADLVPATDALSMQLEELIAVDEDGDVIPAAVPESATAGQDFAIFDPVAAEGDGGGSDYSLTLHGLELETDPAGDLPPVTGPDFTATDFDPLLAELDAELPDVPLPDVSPLPEVEWQGGLVEDFIAVDAVSQEDVAPAPAAVAEPRISFGELSLADDAAPPAVAHTAGPRHDLGDLERRIASLELVDDTREGVVLVLAGIGGPDAVRQLLGGIPARFERAILIRQRLDGARYDKLVAQLQRASALPVSLAEAGTVPQRGHIYILGDDVGLDAKGAFATASGDTLLRQLPAVGSAVIVLSGADPSLTDAVAALAGQGTFVGAQAPDGCYDAAAADAVAARGGTRAPPSELAAMLAGRWGR